MYVNIIWHAILCLGLQQEEEEEPHTLILCPQASHIADTVLIDDKLYPINYSPLCTILLDDTDGMTSWCRLSYAHGMYVSEVL